MNTASQVLYVYHCSACGHRGNVHLPGDTHDGEAAQCKSCGGPVVLEWDGGVTLHFAPPSGDGSADS